MTMYGRYNPENEGNGSSLFSLGEVPLTSVKLNRWNGNIDSSLEILTRACSILFGGRMRNYILYGATESELKVVAQTVPNMTVKVKEGKGILSQFIVGIEEDVTITIEVPVANSRYDSIYISQEGEVKKVEGEEGVSPGFPMIPPNSLRLASVYVRYGGTSVKDNDDGVNSYIVDQRPRRLKGLAHEHNTDRVPTESPDGSQTEFSTSKKFVEDSLEVYVNGLLQAAGISYSPDADRRGYTFSTAPKAGFSIEHRYLIEE